MDMKDEPEIIEHFSHHHPLKLKSYEFCYACYCCGLGYDSRALAFMYTCDDQACQDPSWERYRNEFLCLACARLGESVEHHALHPQHPQIRLVHERGSRHGKCNACCGFISNKVFRYACDDDQCDFEMHVKCAHSVKPVLALPCHRFHGHLLAIVIGSTFISAIKCKSCRFDIRAGTAFARCVPCNMNYHFYCERRDYYMPRTYLYVRCHPQHPLSFRVKRLGYSSCDVCGKKRDWPTIPMYDCLECNNFSAHVSCVFQSLPCPSSSVICPDIPYTMIKESSSVHEAASCQGCKKRVLNRLPVYGCQYCNLFVHESCFQRPIQYGKLCSHPGYDSRRNDPLMLVFAHGLQDTCACCDRKCIGFMYMREKELSFVLDLQCVSLVHSLEVTGHEHPVIVLQESNETKSSYLRCTPCRKSFNITESPCRLPLTLQHECHFHPLTLVARLVDTDEAGGCYCDVCEGMRDPDEYVYHCDECKFEAHITCVKSEVLGPSCNKLKDVEFVNLYEIEKEEKKRKAEIREILCLGKEVQHAYTLEKEFNVIFREISKVTLESFIGRDKGPPNKILYSDYPFKKFIQKLNSTLTWEKTCLNLKSLKQEEVVRVGEYLVPLKFEGVLETMFDSYGDFGAKCKCSPEAKQYLFVGVCKALTKMRDTKVVRVTEDMLIEWWIWLVMGNAAGFKIQFAIEIWEQAMYAHFGLEADKYADQNLTRVRKKMKELPQEIEELAKKLEKARRELEEAIVEEDVLREAAFRVKKSDFMIKCLNKAEDLVCYSIGEMLLPPPEENDNGA